ncbi:fatty acyl-CoA reductase [Musa troglodytarum]|uniref:Fatty acyl-CoA reductase n=1 Tax=Musa troglodytarum TaxID=320322 RepID=A0A9E7HIK7_9LILI|nr:fatty acyl-CoA reductase [Musa troglodytarum]
MLRRSDVGLSHRGRLERRRGDDVIRLYDRRPGVSSYLISLSEVQVVLNVAGTTNFDERYDVALGVNVLGAKHILEFAKRCVRLEMLLHVSTAYVAGEQSGLILEKKFLMGETLKGDSYLDIEAELSLADEKKRSSAQRTRPRKQRS